MLIVMVALLLAYSIYWSYIVLSGPLPSFDLRGHLYFLVSIAPVVIWPLILFAKSLGTAIIVLFVALIASQFGTYLGVRFSEPLEISIAIYGGFFLIFCWALIHMLKNLVCSRDSLMGAFCSITASIFFISFIWFVLKMGCQSKSVSNVFYGASAQSGELLLMAVYALLVVSGVMCLSIPAAKAAWLMQIVLFVMVVHSFSSEGFQAQWFGEVLVVVMIVVATSVPIYAMTKLKRG